MEESLQLAMQQRLQQGLSPLQVRYVKMLEMNGPEIEEEVRRTVDDNPALEPVEESSDTDRDIPNYRLYIDNRGRDDDRFEPQIAQEGEGLMESLDRQLGELDLSDRQRQIARYIIGNLDGNGYLHRDTGEIADDLAITLGLDTDRHEVNEALAIVRRLEPAGVGARDLRECLLLQLPDTRKDASSQTARSIIRDYFDLFSKMHWDRIKSALNIDDDRLRDALAVIRSLNPKPGPGGETSASNHPVIPDFSVEVDDDGVMTLQLLNNVPDLQIAKSFRPEGDGRQQDARTRVMREEGEGFIKALKMRQQTLFRVMEAITRLQHDFFVSEDPADLHPMILRDIEAITKDDVSVISRATAGKYVATPTSIYPLKFFFNERPKSEAEDISLHRILQALQVLIDDEDKKHPQSDEALTKALREQGFDIARRTVAKYRERLGIPVARLRKKL